MLLPRRKNIKEHSLQLYILTPKVFTLIFSRSLLSFNESLITMFLPEWYLKLNLEPCLGRF